MVHGKGKLTSPDGFVIEGVWKNNLLIDKHYIDKILSGSVSQSFKARTRKFRTGKNKSVAILKNHLQTLSDDRSNSTHSFSKRPLLDTLMKSMQNPNIPKEQL